jgi:hypothetical protein
VISLAKCCELLEKINRREELVSEVGAWFAAVAKPGQRRRTQDPFP